MKALDSWARQFGYADYDTYIRSGGNVDEAARDISRRIVWLQNALDAITVKAPTDAEPMAKTPPLEPPGNFHTDPDEPPDPDNAHIQGADG